MTPEIAAKKLGDFLGKRILASEVLIAKYQPMIEIEGYGPENAELEKTKWLYPLKDHQTGIEFGFIAINAQGDFSYHGQEIGKFDRSVPVENIDEVEKIIASLLIKNNQKSFIYLIAAICFSALFIIADLLFLILTHAALHQYMASLVLYSLPGIVIWICCLLIRCTKIRTRFKEKFNKDYYVDKYQIIRSDELKFNDFLS